MYNYELLDIVADLALGLAAALYISLRVSGWIGGLILGGAIALGFFVWEMVNNVLAIVSNERLKEELRRRVIVRRRKWYVAALAVALITLLWVSAVPILVRVLLTVVLASIGFLVYCAKRQTRLKDDKTPL